MFTQAETSLTRGKPTVCESPRHTLLQELDTPCGSDGDPAPLVPLTLGTVRRRESGRKAQASQTQRIASLNLYRRVSYVVFRAFGFWSDSRDGGTLTENEK